MIGVKKSERKVILVEAKTYEEEGEEKRVGNIEMASTTMNSGGLPTYLQLLSGTEEYNSII